MPPFDWLLRGGAIIDGTGAPRYHGDLAIAGDRIADFLRPGDPAPVDLPPDRVLDVSGRIVAPGFIDVHNHSDGWLLKIPHLVSKTTQGITTEVLASDGISYAPLTPESAPHWLLYLRSLNGLTQHDYQGWRTIEDYLALLDRRTAQNVAFQVPYANVRVLAMDWRRDRPDDFQIRRMQAEVRRGMEAGATGVSTGLDYIAQCFADTAELAEVCSAMQPTGGVYVTHVRYKKGTLAGVKEAVDIGRRAGVAVHISHLKGTSERETDALLDYIDRVAIREVDFSFDVYPYLPGSSMLNYFLPYEAFEDGPLGVTAKLADPAFRRRCGEHLADQALALDNIRIAWTPTDANAHLRGMSLAEAFARTGKPLGDALADLLIEEQLAVLCVFHVGDDRLVEPFLDHPKFMLGSDGIYFPGGQVHPRQFGSATRILGPLVRDRKLFTLETAVQKMTSFPAQRFGLTDRGVLRGGAFADVVVFDPTTVTDRATFDDPQQLSTGVEHVFVNGQPIIRDGAPLESFAEYPGRALRYRR